MEYRTEGGGLSITVPKLWGDWSIGLRGMILSVVLVQSSSD